MVNPEQPEAHPFEFQEINAEALECMRTNGVAVIKGYLSPEERAEIIDAAYAKYGDETNFYPGWRAPDEKAGREFLDNTAADEATRAVAPILSKLGQSLNSTSEEGSPLSQWLAEQ